MIVQVNYKTVRDVADFRRLIAAAKERVHLVLLRAGPDFIISRAVVAPLNPRVDWVRGPC